MGGVRSAVWLLLGVAWGSAVAGQAEQALQPLQRAEDMCRQLSKAPAAAADAAEIVRTLDRLHASESLQAVANAGLVDRLQTSNDCLLARLQVPMPGAKGATLATIIGRVLAADTQLPLSGVPVAAFEYSRGSAAPSGEGVVAQRVTDEAGQFTLSLPAGLYTVSIQAPPAGMLAEAWPNRYCALDTQVCVGGGQLVGLEAGQTVSNIDFELEQGAEISGRITRADNGSAVPGSQVQVRAFLEDSAFAATGSVDAEGGTYRIVGLPAGRYRVAVVANAASGLATELHTGQRCRRCERLLPSNWVALQPADLASGVDFTLDPGLSISGRVLTAGDLVPLSVATVTLEDEAGIEGPSSYPINPADGSYLAHGLPEGRYRMQARGSGNDQRIPVTVGNRPCFQLLTCGLRDDAELVEVLATQVQATQVDFQLGLGLSVDVLVREGNPAAPLVGQGFVQMVRSYPEGMSRTQGTHNNGVFRLSGLLPGQYFIDARSQTSGQTTGGLVSFVVEEQPEVQSVTVDLKSGATSLGVEGTASISGVVFDHELGVPLPLASVGLQSLENRISYSTSQRIDPISGQVGYVLNRVLAGRYVLVFAPVTNAQGAFRAAGAGGQSCQSVDCSADPLAEIVIGDGEALRFDSRQRRGATLSGTVGGADIDHAPLLGAGVLDSGLFQLANNGVQVFAPAHRSVTPNLFGQVTGFTGRFGRRYTTPALSPGIYRAEVRADRLIAPDFVKQRYQGLDCPLAACPRDAGTPIEVGSDHVAGIDFHYRRGGNIRGRVRRADNGQPLGRIFVRAHDRSGAVAGSGSTDAQGDYRIGGLPAGEYFVRTSLPMGGDTANLPVQNQLYPALPCSPSCNPLSGGAVTVQADSSTAGIDFSLPPGAELVGRVRRNGVALAAATVEVYSPLGNLLGSAVTQNDGHYRVLGMAAGQAHVRTRSGSVDQVYGGSDCHPADCALAGGSAVTLSTSTPVMGVDFDLAEPASLTGSVRRAEDSLPISGIGVQLLNAQGELLASASSDGQGGFRFDHLAAGDVRLVTRGAGQRIDLAYPAEPCGPRCDGRNGDLIAVGEASAVTGMDFSLAVGGQISGRVRDGQQQPLPATRVNLHAADGQLLLEGATDALGDYTFVGLPSASYRVRTLNQAGLRDEAYAGRACSGSCDLANADAIELGNAAVVSGIDFELQPGGAIRGVVTTSTGNPLQGVEIVAYDGADGETARVISGIDGGYLMAGLPSGGYRLRSFNEQNYVDQVHAERGCTPAPCNVSEGDAILIAGGEVSGIDFALAQGHTVAGAAFDESNNPLPAGQAMLLDGQGRSVAEASISDGAFEFSRIAAGSYYLLVRNQSGLVDQLYAGISCPAGTCDLSQGVPIEVPAESSAAKGTSRDLTLRLATGARIGGSVRDRQSELPLADVGIFLLDSQGREVARARSGADGRYLSESGLPAGNYFVASSSEQASGAPAGYTNAAHVGIDCALSCDLGQATAVALAGIDIAGIDLSLAPSPATIRGRIRDEAGNALALVEVRLIDASGRAAGQAFSNSLGDYQLTGLPAGTYYLHTRNALGLLDSLFGGSTCSGTCAPLQGTAVPVASGAEATAIDFTLNRRPRIFRDGFETPPQ